MCKTGTKNTTVNLSSRVQSIKNRLAPIYGLKSVISAGLVLLDRLEDSEQKKIIQEVNAPPSQETVRTEVARLVGELSYDEQSLILQELTKKQKKIGSTAKVDASENKQGQVSKAVHVIREMSPDGTLSIEFLSDEDRKAIDELAKLVRRETKKSNKSKEA